MIKRYLDQVGFSSNVFLITNEKNESILIDPGHVSKRLLEDLKNTNLKAILLTHGHFDHVQCLDKITSIYNNVKVYCFEEEDFLLNPKKNCSSMYIYKVSITSKFESFNDEINIGDFSIKVYLTPGHSAGSVIYYFEKEKAIFFGDTILELSIGRTDLYSASNSEMKKSLEYIKTIDFKDDDICYFGHGEKMDYKYLIQNHYYL